MNHVCATLPRDQLQQPTVLTVTCPKRIVVDIETRSAADLKKVGAAAYAADPTTSITHLGWSQRRPCACVATGARVRTERAVRHAGRRADRAHRAQRRF